MGKIKTPQNISNLETFEDFRKYASIAVDDIIDAVNGHITLTENTDTSISSATFVAANATIAVTHGLNRVPSGYIVIGKSAAVHIFDGSGTNTNKIIYLQASGACTASVLVF